MDEEKLGTAWTRLEYNFLGIYIYIYIIFFHLYLKLLKYSCLHVVCFKIYVNIIFYKYKLF